METDAIVVCTPVLFVATRVRRSVGSSWRDGFGLGRAVGWSPSRAREGLPAASGTMFTLGLLRPWRKASLRPLNNFGGRPAGRVFSVGPPRAGDGALALACRVDSRSSLLPVTSSLSVPVRLVPFSVSSSSPSSEEVGSVLFCQSTDAFVLLTFLLYPSRRRRPSWLCLLGIRLCPLVRKNPADRRLSSPPPLFLS